MLWPLKQNKPAKLPTHGKKLAESRRLDRIGPYIRTFTLRPVLYTIIPAIIIDESQYAKGADSVLLKAIKSLQYNTAFLLSGTPVHNKWTDLYGQMSILPGCPFQDFDHFSETFCGVDSQGMLMQIPDNEKQQLLIGLLSGMVIKRPKAIVGLPEFQHTQGEVPLTDETYKDVITLIRTLTRKVVKSILKPKGKEMQTAEPDEAVDDDEETVEIPLVAAHLLVVNEELNMAGNVDAAVPSNIDDNADPDMDSQTVTKHTKAGLKEDPDEAWTKFLSNAEDDKIFTPRIQATIDLLVRLRQSYPEEKIVITAESLKILDVVYEAITRKQKSSNGSAGLFDIEIAVYNGRISSIDIRA
ncbi:hypothetical protein GE21DRAFT_6987 [Neurospora crassa]|uniref:SNF2 N-terminal domain-containing protein n=1 Tax=Neurospora crassa (strain ATCC 24698 / 74-OR23-1A / CBS 708.71 / DSM 1257 / FGSC 987) TaxID=367110 RepID=Q7S2H0_NEUCR|nr:hypothetical protein NCU08883 [Neurospora crassa OR74A]EAA29585.1 hypothetical protein NCU08883 [Neurospora crassa OR74A]KHE81079.1 hypothetical protein GE21DRAFT_6987 [Neurospora crassa]|eukprot:XP_958821.1 hypothetical protein NCU08883 [Neurospora crassa OR74A]